jgi:hypothetical protein
MKTGRHKQILLILFVSIFLYSCNLFQNDYREAYIGTYRFSVKITEFNTDSVGYFFQDSIIYQGKISFGENDNDILIQYSTDNFITLTLEEDGQLSNLPTTYGSGEFVQTDSLNLYLRWGGLGGGTSHDIKGKKQ